MSVRDYHIYIGKLVDGEFVKRDLELSFPGLLYKSVTGISSYGSPVVYEESYAEDEELDVYYPSVVNFERPNIVLSLYFIGSYADVTAVDDASRHRALERCFRDFMDYIVGCDLVYWDTIRNRKVKMYLSGEVKVNSERLYGEPYKEVSFTFKNKYGRSFSMDDPVFAPVFISV